LALVLFTCVKVHDCVTAGFVLTSMHTPVDALIAHDCVVDVFVGVPAAGLQRNVDADALRSACRITILVRLSIAA
jgi:hypothetical protein